MSARDPLDEIEHLVERAPPQWDSLAELEQELLEEPAEPVPTEEGAS